MASYKPFQPALKFSNKITLSGHKAPVTCLSINTSESLLASASEDKSIRIWDLSSKKCIKVCLPPKALFNAPAEASTGSETAEENEILATAFWDGNILVISVGPTLVLFNLSGNDVIINTPVAELALEAGDINTIEVVRAEHNTLVCGCDDGIVEVELQHVEGSYSLVKKSRLDAHAGTFVSTVKPLARGDALHYVSGGYDCKVAYTMPSAEPVVFDLSTPATTSGNVKQMFNPPYIYSLDVLESGPWVIASTGSGALEVLNIDQKVRAESEEAHSSAVNFVSFTRFSLPGLPNLLLSTGNDGFLAIRSVQPPNDANTAQYAETLQRLTELQGRITAAKKATKIQAKLLTSLETQLKKLQGAPKLNLVFKAKLPNVVNWCCSSSKLSNCGNLFVADTTDAITCYTISPSS